MPKLRLIQTLACITLTVNLAGCFDFGSDNDVDSAEVFTSRWAHQDTNTSDGADYLYGEDGTWDESAYNGDSTPVYINSTKLHPPPLKTKPHQAGKASNRQRYVALIHRASQKHGVEVELIHAIISRESQYRSWVGSPAGAWGLMQMLPATGNKYGCTALKNPECNVMAGTGYLKKLSVQFNGNIQTIATGYNAGEGVADSYLYGKRLKGKNPTGIKTPNGVPLASFSMSAAQKRVCPSNNWNPTSNCEGETYHYVRWVTGFYLMYKQMPELVGKAAVLSPSAQAYRRGNIL